VNKSLNCYSDTRT